MSEAVLLAGKRGSGKSLGALSMIERYMKEGRTVATNMDLFVDKLVPAYVDTRWYRLPDYPTAEDLKELPLGNPIPTEEKRNGLLCLDEVATYLNSREWSGSGRQDLISWLVQSRKYGWDLLLIAQHANLIDKQVRDALIEIQGTVRRMDKMQVPVLSALWKYFFQKPLHFPRIHFVALRYGFAFNAPVADRWFWRGAELHAAYNTLQKISPLTGQVGTSTMLSAWDLKGRYMSKWDLRRQMAAGGLVIGLLLGFAGGFGAAKWQPAVKPVVAEALDPAVKVRGIAQDGSGRNVVILTDGRTGIATSMKSDGKGTRYLVAGVWYGGQ